MFGDFGGGGGGGVVLVLSADYSLPCDHTSPRTWHHIFSHSTEYYCIVIDSVIQK